MSPVVFRLNGVKFHFFANEGNPREPIHIHASRPGSTAKIWLYPEVCVARNKGYDRVEMASLITAVRARQGEIEKAWNEFFGDGSQV